MLVTAVWKDNDITLSACNRYVLIAESDITVIKFLIDRFVQVSFKDCTWLSLLGATKIQQK